VTPEAIRAAHRRSTVKRLAGQETVLGWGTRGANPLAGWRRLEDLAAMWLLVHPDFIDEFTYA
jgi:hypothetical protein